MARVPQIIKDAARNLIQMYGDKIDYLGKYEGADAYLYHYPDDVCAGYPHVFLLKDGKVDDVTDSLALYIISLLVKDLDEVEVE